MARRVGPASPRVALVPAAVLAVLAMLVSACSDGHLDVRSVASPGWSSYGGNAGNANFAYPDVPDDLQLSWTRPTGGPVTVPVTLSNQSNVGVVADTATGCNVFVFDPRNGRKNFCKRMRAGTEVSSVLVDQYDQSYFGEEAKFIAFNAGGAIRWQMPLIGVPLSAKFAAPGVVLVVTTQGQILLIDTQTGTFAAPEVRLRSDADPGNPRDGIGDCVTNGPRCVVPAPAAVDTERERFYLNVWRPGTIASHVVAMTYAPEDAKAADKDADGTSAEATSGQTGSRTVREAWHADIPGGVVGPVTLSTDGRTAYVFSRLGRIYALDADTGKTRWSYDNGGYGFATMSVSPDGLIIPTGVLGAPLTALRDRGDRAEKVWQRDDVRTAGLTTQTAQHRAWTVARDRGKDSLSLVEVSTADGTPTRRIAMPGSVGFTTGVAVSQDGQIATATNIGEVYFFDRKSSIDEH